MKRESSLFDKLLKSISINKMPVRTRQSLEWHKNKILSLFGSKFIHPANIFDKSNYKNRPQPGTIVTFKYSPKNADTLNYYDTYPLVLILDVYPGGFMGLNFHYLSPAHRALFMDRLYDYMQYSNKNKRFQINITYNILKNRPLLNYYRPCIKKYLNSYIGNFFYTLMPHEWDVALFLPTENFMKESESVIWKESAEIIRKK